MSGTLRQAHLVNMYIPYAHISLGMHPAVHTVGLIGQHVAPVVKGVISCCTKCSCLG